MESLLRRSHELVLKFKDGEVISFRYPEATVLETLEYAEESSRPGFMPERWLFDFFASRTTISETEFGHLGADIRTVYDSVMRTRFPGSHSPSEDTCERTPRYSPLSAYIVEAAARLHTDPLTLMERYTFTQLSAFMGGVVWNLNEQTPQGRSENDRERRKHAKESGSIDRDLQLARQVEEMVRRERTASDPSAK